MGAHLGSFLRSFPEALSLLELDAPAAPSGQRWPGPLTPASLGNPRHACLFCQGSLEFPHMAGIGTGERGRGGRKRAGWLVTHWEGWLMLTAGQVQSEGENSPL